jgi:hypothetical protein
VKRLIFLICLVVLIFDLSDDGFLGKVKFVAPSHTAQYSVASPQQNSAPDDSQVSLPPENLPNIFDLFPGEPASAGMVHGFKISDFFLVNSSGGLPR